MTRFVLCIIIVAIVVAHVFMWRSDMPTDMKITFTTINTIAWTIVLAPIVLVGRWLNAIQQRNQADQGTGNDQP